MRAKKGLIIQKIDDAYYLIDSGEELPKFNGMVQLNTTSHFIITKLMEKELTMDELYKLLLLNFNVTMPELQKTIPGAVDQLKKIHIVVD